MAQIDISATRIQTLINFVRSKDIERVIGAVVFKELVKLCNYHQTDPKDRPPYLSLFRLEPVFACLSRDEVLAISPLVKKAQTEEGLSREEDWENFAFFLNEWRCRVGGIESGAAVGAIQRVSPQP